MAGDTQLLEDKEFIRIQNLNSTDNKSKRRSIVYDKPVPGLEAEDSGRIVVQSSDELLNEEELTKVLSNASVEQEVKDEIFKTWIKKLSQIQERRYRPGVNKTISFFGDVDFGNRATVFDQVVSQPYINTFNGPIIEKQMKEFEKINRTLKNPNIKTLDTLKHDFSGLYIIFWFIVGWVSFRNIVDYYIENDGDLSHIEVLNLLLERLDLVFALDALLFISTFFVVIIQYLVKWNFFNWDPVGRYIVFSYELLFAFTANYLPIVVFELNWISRIFFFLHSMVFVMKMHSFSFFNGYLWNIKRELHYSKTALKKYQHISSPEIINTLKKSEEFCNYELSTQSCETHFPDNIGFKNYFMFNMFPTLVYQIDYPRTNKIRWGYVGEKFCACFGSLCLMILTAQVYLYPTCIRVIRLAEHPWPDFWTSTVEWLYLVTEIIPGFSVMFMLTFYFIWDAFLNCVAELTCFADRYFYGDWWNCTTFAEWSRLWNVPVHKWLLRHVFHSLMNHFRLTSAQATLYTFILSSILHEISLFVIFKKVRPFMFLFQMTQIPTAYFSKRPPFNTRPGLCNICFVFAILSGMTFIACIYVIY